MKMEIRIILVQIFMSISVNAACFFPTELQGSYAVQYVEGNKSDIWYRSVSISYDFISGLGQCVFRQRERYVLETEAGCYKCVGLKQRSYNVLTLVDTDTCYTSPDVAWATCDDSQGSKRQGDVEKYLMQLSGIENHLRISVETLTGDFIDEDVGEGEEHHHVGEGED